MDVRAFRAGQWCAPEAQYPWGVICNLSIVPAMQGSGGVNMAGEDGLSPVIAPSFTMWPKPSRGDEVWLSLAAFDETVQTAQVDIYTMTGQRVDARKIALQDGAITTDLDLRGQLATGMYLVHVTAGDEVFTQRLVIAP